MGLSAAGLVESRVSQPRQGGCFRIPSRSTRRRRRTTPSFAWDRIQMGIHHLYAIILQTVFTNSNQNGQTHRMVFKGC